MDKLETAMLRAAQAEQLQANPMFAVAFEETRAAIFETWAALPTSESENAKDLHRKPVHHSPISSKALSHASLASSRN